MRLVGVEGSGGSVATDVSQGYPYFYSNNELQRLLQSSLSTHDPRQLQWLSWQSWSPAESSAALLDGCCRQMAVTLSMRAVEAATIDLEEWSGARCRGGLPWDSHGSVWGMPEHMSHRAAYSSTGSEVLPLEVVFVRQKFVRLPSTLKPSTPRRTLHYGRLCTVDGRACCSRGCMLAISCGRASWR